MQDYCIQHTFVFGKKEPEMVDFRIMYKSLCKDTLKSLIFL